MYLSTRLTENITVNFECYLQKTVSLCSEKSKRFWIIFALFFGSFWLVKIKTGKTANGMVYYPGGPLDKRGRVTCHIGFDRKAWQNIPSYFNLCFHWTMQAPIGSYNDKFPQSQHWTPRVSMGILLRLQTPLGNGAEMESVKRLYSRASYV